MHHLPIPFIIDGSHVETWEPSRLHRQTHHIAWAAETGEIDGDDAVFHHQALGLVD